ncbi:MAG: ferritin-like domain-containing protein [Rhodospirillales bacterium]|nr:ferritin-like domain-containing protein [Rhodospirillales bacterium]
MKHWTLDDIDWSAFDPSKVDPDILAIVKAASMVERNGLDYATYLCNVFDDDPEFQEAARGWAAEEVQHGRALGRWAQLADPAWDFAAAFKRFTDGYKLPLDATRSVRGTRTGELIARCIVETGTSSYYSALAEAAIEPVLKDICRKIAADEFRHYKLFYAHMTRYQTVERLGRWRRLAAGIGRMFEAEDDELSYAYYAANGVRGPYDRRSNARAYAGRAYRVYRPWHIERAVGMTLKAVGFKPNGRLHRFATQLTSHLLQRRALAYARAEI